MYAAKGWHPAPPATTRDRGIGPFKRLVLRGATVIDGTGAPPCGPFDIVIESGRITAMVPVGTPHLPIKPEGRPAGGDHEIDCSGRYVMPGLIDAHAHIRTTRYAMTGPIPPPTYAYKLWLAHGITTIRETGCFNGLGYTLQQKDASARYEIVAPNIMAYAYCPVTNDLVKTIHTSDQATAWVHEIKARGADGIKFIGAASPSIMRAALDAAGKEGLRSACHHAQMAVTRVNALKSARWGLTSSEHYYGLPEALYDDRVVQDFPADYNYNDEYFRFAAAGQSFLQAAKPGSAKWKETMNEFLELGLTFVPTFTIYNANRDVMRARRADWHQEYTWKSIWKYYQPQRGGHGSYWTQWSTRNEIEWKQHFQLWMQFVNEYKNLGGRVCTGSDSGFIFQIFGFSLIQELELLQEAGFHPLEAIRAATSHGAELLGIADETGSIDVGKRADILILDDNPLADFKLLYGTGALRFNDDTGKTQWRRALRWTIKSGMIFDVDELLQDVRDMVRESWNDGSDETPDAR
ncbi:MAG: amidohydrolase [Castellaniella sp.]|nr:MAG: amidohydrolase [Castellaniella sp.]